MPVEPRGLAAQAVLIQKGGRGEMTKAPIRLQDLRRRLYIQAKADFGWKRWSREWLYGTLGLFSGYRVSYQPSASAVAPV